MTSHDDGGDDDDGDNDDDWTDLPFVAKLSLAPGGLGLVALRLDTVWTWGSGSLRSYVSWPRWVRNAFWSKDLVFSTKSHWFSMRYHEIFRSKQVLQDPHFHTEPLISCYDSYLWDRWFCIETCLFPQCSRAWCCRECLGSGAVMCSQRSLGLTASAAQLKPKDLCAYMSKISGNSRHGYTMVYNIMQPIYDNDTMASEQKGDVYNPMKRWTTLISNPTNCQIGRCCRSQCF